jgi:drug/metabolite transporter (DMT)-like permease
VPTLPLVLALCAALVHASWNLVLSRARDSEAATAVALVFGAAVWAPVAAITWEVGAGALPYAAGSAVLELVYLALLAYAYQEGELSVVYPVARGSAPLLVLGFSLAVLGVSLSAVGIAGVCLVAAGVMLVRGPRSGARPRDFRLALAIGASIAAYTLIDKQGLKHAHALPYLELILAPPAVVYAAALGRRRGAASLRAELGLPAALAGLGMFGAFGLVLAALRLAPNSAVPGVQAVRETSVVIAVALARIVLGERVSGPRAAGALAVVAGVAAIAAS